VTIQGLLSPRLEPVITLTLRNGEERFVMAQDGSGLPLVGMMLLLDCEVTIQVRYEGAVSIGRLTNTG
jgi:hypothetical protein